MRDVNLNCIYLQRYIMSQFSSKFGLCVKMLQAEYSEGKLTSMQ